jgi:hypothetical protein
MTVRQAVYGLVLRSAQALPGLDALGGSVVGPAAGDADVDVELGRRPPWAGDAVTDVVHRAEPEDSAPADAPPVVVVERLGEAGTRLVYGEGIRFHVSRALDHIWADWDAPLSDADAMSFLLGPVLGHVLRGQGVLALHASAVVVAGRLIGFVGPGGAGKSTLAASLALAGHGVLSDDVLALRERAGRWWGAPANAQVRLWDASARLLFGDAHALPAISAAWEKRLLDLDAPGYRRAQAPVPLAGLVLLDGDPSPREGAAVEPAGGQEALLSLIGNSYVPYLLDDAGRARELAAIARLVLAVPVGRLRRPLGGGEPRAVVAAVEDWARRVTV